IYIFSLFTLITPVSLAQDDSRKYTDSTAITSTNTDTSRPAAAAAKQADAAVDALSRPKSGRIWLVAGTHAVIWTGTFIALDRAWYSGYPKSSFHFFNDWQEWNQMDKGGHMWTSYQISRVSTEMWRWTGLKDNTSILLGGASALAYQSIIEI